jgi:PIN domain nuclease of toxin-antitoxin system
MARLLLDTHVALWWLTAHPRLGSEAQELIADSECHLSAASVWEVAIKYRRGKLPIAPRELVTAAREAGIRPLPISHEHAAASADLPLLHADPFDRLLVAQARLEQLRFITADQQLCQYGGDIHVL